MTGTRGKPVFKTETLRQRYATPNFCLHGHADDAVTASSAIL